MFPDGTFKITHEMAGNEKGDDMRNTVFCVISAPGAFEIKIEKVPLFSAILYQFLQKLQTFLLPTAFYFCFNRLVSIYTLYSFFSSCLYTFLTVSFLSLLPYFTLFSNIFFFLFYRFSSCFFSFTSFIFYFLTQSDLTPCS